MDPGAPAAKKVATPNSKFDIVSLVILGMVAARGCQKKVTERAPPKWEV
jgi:hypothetical protein